MAVRVDSELLLVGSLPAGSTDEALRTAGPLFGDVVFALPDGETGPRAAWVGYERNELFEPHPDLEAVDRPRSPDGIPRHPYDAPSYRLRPGVSELHFDRWPRIDEAIESYRVFQTLRDEGVIPRSLRFQVGLPFPGSAIIGGFKRNFAEDYPIVEAAYEDLVRRGIEQLTSAIPPDDLAVQWDVAYETLDLEGVIAWTSPGAWERYTGSIGRLAPLVPDEALMGFHLCYGTFPEWPMYEARDMGQLVRMAHAALESAGRPVDWLHMAGPRFLRSEEDAFFRPLHDLERGDTRVYLGIIQPIDGVEGASLRARTASRHLSDFGVAMYCGFGRQPGHDGQATMRAHREVVDALSQPAS